MHGLIFETSVCYWQNQPGCYSWIWKTKTDLNLSKLEKVWKPIFPSEFHRQQNEMVRPNHCWQGIFKQFFFISSISPRFRGKLMIKSLFRFWSKRIYLGAFQPSLHQTMKIQTTMHWSCKIPKIKQYPKRLYKTISFVMSKITGHNKKANLSNQVVVQSDVNPIMSSSCHSLHFFVETVEIPAPMICSEIFFCLPRNAGNNRTALYKLHRTHIWICIRF